MLPVHGAPVTDPDAVSAPVLTLRTKASMRPALNTTTYCVTWLTMKSPAMPGPDRVASHHDPGRRMVPPPIRMRRLSSDLAPFLYWSVSCRMATSGDNSPAEKFVCRDLRLGMMTPQRARSEYPKQ